MNNKHEVLIGPYRSGKSWSLLNKAIEHCRQQKNLASETLIIVPSQRYRALTEKRIHELLLQEKKGNEKAAGLWGLKILTFDQFCQTSLLKAGAFTKKLPDAARSSLVAAIGNHLLDEGKIEKLAPVINFSGTRSSILELVQEWQASGYKASQVLKQIKTKEQNGHHIELAEIYSRYEQILQRSNYVDEHGSMFKLIDLLNSADKVNWLSDFIIVDGFDRWHILQLKLLRALTKHVPEIHVSFDYEQLGDNLLEEYAWKEKSYEQVKELLGGVFEFRTGPQASPLPANENIRAIEVFCAGDRLAETAIIAARVKAAIVVDNLKPAEIVITARNLDIYKPAFEAAFQDAGLDYYLDQSTALITLPVAQFLLMLLSLAENDFKRRQVIDCLRSPYFRLDNFGLTIDDVELLNKQSLDEKIKVVCGRKRWQMAAKGDFRLSAALMKVFDTVTALPNNSSAIQYVTWVEDLFAEVVDLASLHDLGIQAINQFRICVAQLIEQEEILKRCAYDESIMREEPAAAARDISYAERAAAESKTHVGARLAEPVRSDDIRRNRRGEIHPPVFLPSDAAKYYHQQLIELIKNANMPASHSDADKILITGAAFVPNQKFKQIYVAGMLEGEFPTHNPGKGFLTPEELTQWQRFGIPVYDPRLEPGFEYALFASLINRAQNKITFSYPAADITSSKEEPVPSFFLSSLSLGQENKQPELLSFENFSKSANSHANALAYCLWHQIPIQHLSNKNPHLFDFLHKIEKKLNFAQKRSQALSPGPLAGYLVDQVTNGTVKINLPEYWSASQLNEYGKCPFRYWVSRALKLKPHTEPEAGLLATERGSFYHKALELFYKEVIARQLIINVENEKQLLVLFEQAIADAITWVEKESWFQPTEFWVQEKEDLAFHLRNFCAAEIKRFVKEGEQFRPYMVEVEFGPEQLPPLILSKDDKSIKFRGKIDRIDIETTSWNTGEAVGADFVPPAPAPTRLRLVDYKSGHTLPTGADFESGRDIQLPLYALAAEQAILPDSHAQAYTYLSIRAGRASGEDGAVLRTYLNALPDKIFQSIESIKSGDFSLRPSKADICRTCDHQTVCRIKEFPKSLAIDQDQFENENGNND